MCGVIGLVYERSRPDLGRIAGELLRTLEYRGYDSTGAVLQGDGDACDLRKGVGAPSAMIHSLGIVGLGGQLLCGQVRWATFGAVDEANAQPHVVRCHTYLYGAHNGNVTNCDALKAWLEREGHAVASDNDGEMVVHTVEHAFAARLRSLDASAQRNPTARRALMRASLVDAAGRLQGSYAAVIVDPVSRCAWAVKSGSSLYFGVGADDAGGRFGIASSDLSSVLKLTRILVPMAEGEFVEFDGHGAWQLYGVADRTIPSPDGPRRVEAGEPIARQPVRSRLRAEDTTLQPLFASFMEQEIAAQVATCRAVVRLFQGGSLAARTLLPYLGDEDSTARSVLWSGWELLREQIDDDRIAATWRALVAEPEVKTLLGSLPEEVVRRGTEGERDLLRRKLASTEAGFLADLLALAEGPGELLVVRLLDVLIEEQELEAFRAAVERFCDDVAAADRAGGRIFIVCCGTSWHAAKAAALFFDAIAGVTVIPLLPGEFRAQCVHSLKDGDVFVAVSQSGETKDLIDVVNDVLASGRAVRRVVLVNNVNSTLAQEKADLVLPLRCGPEVAVPATKSFMNQLAVFYGLALRVGERRAASGDGRAVQALSDHRRRFTALPDHVATTLRTTEAAVEAAAELLYPCPSMHLLATRVIAVALEGALKIREVVLNHTQGYEASEFKHGPNTILGWNTVWGPAQVAALLAALGKLGIAPTDAALWLVGPDGRLAGHAAGTAAAAGLGLALQAARADYPLVYVTGPEVRDINLTVSQINTHKIRGAMTVVIAEDHPALRQAAEKAPADNPAYRSLYIALPPTGDTLATVFSATVALQRLALAMSRKKAAWLDGLGVRDHGVHPDVPKNVSKSITVD
ncbi:MAG: SIS domain-containing protein [Myxococcales bacterium]|nr:SIS domain-containing protein [Myxococcales bacterium]